MTRPTSRPLLACRRPLRWALFVASVAAATLPFAGTALAQAQPAPAPVITAAISVTPNAVTPPETATATATFEVGEIANVQGGRVVTLSLNLLGTDGSLRLASITGSGVGLSCPPPGADPVLTYSCTVGQKTTTDTYTISATILSQTPTSNAPVAAEVSANSSYRDGQNQSIDGPIDRTTLSVLLPGVDPPPGTTISAACVDDQVVVDITANTNNANFFVNVGDDVDLLAPAIPPGSYPFPVGGASDIRVRVFLLPDVDLIFDQTVPCTVTTTTTTTVPSSTSSPTTVVPTTTTAGGAAPELPATGRSAGQLAVLALALVALGGLALSMARRRERSLP